MLNWSFNRGLGGAGETKRLYGWCICVWVLSIYPREVRCHDYMGWAQHPKKVSWKKPFWVLCPLMGCVVGGLLKQFWPLKKLWGTSYWQAAAVKVYLQPVQGLQQLILRKLWRVICISLTKPKCWVQNPIKLGGLCSLDCAVSFWRDLLFQCPGLQQAMQTKYLTLRICGARWK